MTRKHDPRTWKTLSPDESHWNKNTQELTIDLRRWLDEPMTLVLTGWHSPVGISWRNEFAPPQTDGSRPVEWHTDPFEESLFPIEFITHTVLKPWTEQIPADLVKLLKRYKGNAFGMLMLCSRHRHVYELFQQHPTLFWLTFTVAQQHGWTETHFIETCRLTRIGLLKACGFPARKAAVKLLRKLKFRRFAQLEYELIIQLFNLEFDKLNHRPVIPGSLIQFLSDYPELIAAKWMGRCPDGEFKPLRMFVNDIERMSRRLHLDSKTFIDQVGRCTDLRQIQAIHDNLINLLNQRLQRGLMQTLYRHHAQNTQFPEPPLAGNEFIIPITDMKTLLEEGRQQQHCVAGYDEDILQGRYYVYQVLAPERATLGIKIYRTRSQTVGRRIDQLTGFRNQAVEGETQKAVLTWFNSRQKLPSASRGRQERTKQRQVPEGNPQGGPRHD